MRIKVVAVTLLLAAGAAVVGSALRPAEPTAPEAEVVRDGHTVYPRPGAADEQLGRRLPRVQFNNLPLDQAIDQLRAMSGANIDVLWGSFGRDGNGVERTAPVTLDLRDVTLAQALRRTLAQVTSPTWTVGYAVDDGVIVVGANADATRFTTLRVYDVRDVVEAELAWARYDLASQPSPGPPPTAEDAGEQVMKVVTQVVDPDSWLDNGGQVGGIQEMGGRLLVRQTWEAHRRVEELLAGLDERVRPNGLRAMTQPAVPAARPAGE